MCVGTNNDADELIERFLVGAVSDDESAHLEALLLSDATLRSDFCDAAAMDVALREIACGNDEIEGSVIGVFELGKL